jgi:hypothetical protein
MSSSGGGCFARSDVTTPEAVTIIDLTSPSRQPDGSTLGLEVLGRKCRIPDEIVAAESLRLGVGSKELG